MTLLTTALDLVQVAVHNRLTGDATLMALIKGVFDEVDEDQLLDYITISNNFETADNTFGRNGRDVTITLDIWSGASPDGTGNHGFKSGITILGHCIRLLDNNPLTLSHGVNSYIMYNGAPIMMRDPDDQDTRHIVARFFAYIEE